MPRPLAPRDRHGDRCGAGRPRSRARPLGRQEGAAQGGGRESRRIVRCSAVAIPAQADTALTTAPHRAALETFPSAKERESHAIRQRRYRLRQRIGAASLNIEVDEMRLAEALSLRGILDESASRDRGAIAAALSEMIDELVGRGDRTFAVTRNAAAPRKRALIAGMSTSASPRHPISRPGPNCPAPAISIPSSPRSCGPAASARRRSRLMPASCGLSGPGRAGDMRRRPPSGAPPSPVCSLDRATGRSSATGFLPPCEVTIDPLRAARWRPDARCPSTPRAVVLSATMTAAVVREGRATPVPTRSPSSKPQCRPRSRSVPRPSPSRELLEPTRRRHGRLARA